MFWEYEEKLSGVKNNNNFIFFDFIMKIKIEKRLRNMEKKELKERFVDEKTGIEYRLVGNYYIPNITMQKNRRTGNIGKYGILKLNYMKKYKIP